MPESERTYKVEIFNVIETTGGEHKLTCQAGIYEGLSYQNLVELENALVPIVAEALLKMGRDAVAQKFGSPQDNQAKKNR